MLSNRKADHIRISLNEDVNSLMTTGLENYGFIHQALPELDLDKINMGQVLFNKKIKVPLLISSMTGGTPEAMKINFSLAQAAQETGIAMGLGSQRAGIEYPDLQSTFQVRKVAPDILLFSNLGAVQLNYSYTLDHCKRAVDMVEADGLILHMNPLQEALQPEGDVCFSGLLKKIEFVCRHLPVPVIAKEIGWGISEDVAKKLENAGVAAIDVAGAGGTSWSEVERHRIKDPHLAQVAAAFRSWGIPTSKSIENVRRGAPSLLVFASGGLQNGIDIAKCIALGARLGGMARLFLKESLSSCENVVQLIGRIQQEIQICMFAAGIADLAQLMNTKLVMK